METRNPQRLQVEYPQINDSFNPYWIVGFIDGEECFHVGISKHPEVKFGYQILPELTVVQHQRDMALLHQIRTYMKCGVIRRNHGDRFCWRVRNLENLADIILPFFEKYKLKSQKRIEFDQFTKVVRMMVKGEHLTPDGFNNIVKIASLMNRKQNRSDRIKIESMP